MDISKYLSGEKLFGDDFTKDQIAEWFAAEKEGYAGLGASNKQEYLYPYTAQNIFFGYNNLPENISFNVLSIGGAYGDELLPILKSLRKITILEPSDQLSQRDLKGVPISYVKPNENGGMPFDQGEFNLVTCLGVLHHIPNVTAVVNEIYRVLSPGGFFIVREPIVSMGDWRNPRQGLTKNERGIPLVLFRKIMDDSGFRVVKEAFCNCKPFDSIMNKLIGGSIQNRPFYPPFDKMLSMLFRFNYQYHPNGFFRKIRPTSVFSVLQKPLT